MLGSASRHPMITSGNPYSSQPCSPSATRPARASSMTEQSDPHSLSPGGRIVSPHSERHSMTVQAFDESIQLLSVTDPSVEHVERLGAGDWSPTTPSAPQKIDTFPINRPLHSTQISAISSMSRNSHDTDSSYGENDGANDSQQNSFGEDGGLSSTELVSSTVMSTNIPPILTSRQSNWEYHGLCRTAGFATYSDRPRAEILFVHLFRARSKMGY